MVVAGRPAAEPWLWRWIEEAGTIRDHAAARSDATVFRGRGVVYSVPSPVEEAEAWVVRRYHRGGLPGRFLDDRFMRLGEPRPLREYRLARELEALGLPGPRAVGAAVYPAGAFYRGELVTYRVPGAVDLAVVLFGLDRYPGAEGEPDPAPGGTAGPEAEVAMAAAGRLVRRLHDAGLVHPDLNVKNILLAPPWTAPRALVLDLDRARLAGRVSDGARRRMLARFRRSVRKWERRTGRELGAGIVTAFETGYEAGG